MSFATPDINILTNKFKELILVSIQAMSEGWSIDSRWMRSMIDFARLENSSKNDRIPLEKKFMESWDRRNELEKAQLWLSFLNDRFDISIFN